MPTPITRREALRRTVFFSTAALAAGHGNILRAAPAKTKFAQQGLHLLAVGDYGTNGNANQIAMARAMATFAKSLDQPLHAVLALGDNFYKPITPDRFENHFEKMYSADVFNCPFYACAGNHDYGTAKYDLQEGKLQMQLDYAKNNPNSRWKFPAKWYKLELPSADKPLVKVIVLDGNYWEAALKPQEKIEQRRFLEAELKKKSAAPWLWLVNHFPLYSDCPPYAENKPLIREWGPVLKKSPISLCLSGHAHIMQHLHVEGYPQDFIVSGAGGAKLYDIKPSNRGYVDNHNLGFTHLHVTPEKVSVQFIAADATRLHHFERTRSGQTKVAS